MTFVLLFIIATAVLIVLFLVKIRAMQKNPELYLKKLEQGSEWFRMHPEALDRKMKHTADTVVKPTLHKSLVVGFALYKNANVWITRFMRKNFYTLLHYSLKRGEHHEAKTTTKRLRDIHEGNE